MRIIDPPPFHGQPLLEHLRQEESLYSHWAIFPGAVRVCDAGSTLSRVKPLLPLLGITRIAMIDGLDCIGLPVAVCYRPDSRHLSSAQGKGVSRDMAIASAVMECIEGYHMEQPRPTVARGTYAELRRRHAVNPCSLAPGYFEKRALEASVLDWSVTTNLLTGMNTLTPTSLLTLDYSRLVPETNHFAITSNGVASGNCLSEAICHGILEVIERHSLSEWTRLSAAQRDGTLIDLSSLPSGTIRVMIERMRSAGIELKLWDMSLPGFGIPAINCVGVSSLGSHGGSGAHFSKDVAILRALTELAQARAVWISGSRDDLYPAKYAKQRRKRTGRRVKAWPAGTRMYEAIPERSSLNCFADALAALAETLGRCGYDQVLVANHTAAEINVPVVQVIIPGMAMQHDR